MKLLARLSAVCALAAFYTIALAQSAANYPSHSIKIAVPFTPGGPTDLFARMFASHLEKKYHQPAIVENKPGGGIVIASDYVAKSAPDGYTLLSSGGLLVYESVVNKDAPFDSFRDFVPLGYFASNGLFVTVNASLPVKTLPELVDYIKTNPGKVNVANVGAGVAEFQEFRDRLGLTWMDVSYKGGGPAHQAMLAHETDLYLADYNTAISAHKEGKLRMLAYSDLKRHPRMPEVPTIAESGIGLDDFFLRIDLGMYAPSKVPTDIISKLHDDMIELSASPELIERVKSIGWVTNPKSMEALRQDAALSYNRISALAAKGIKLR